MVLNLSVGNLKEWGVELQRHKIKVNQNKKPAFLEFMPVETAASRRKIDLIATGLGKLQQAVNNAINYIYPDKKVQPTLN